MNDRQLRIEVGRRLRATAQELGYPTAQKLGEWLDANRAQVQAWYAGYAMPPVKYMRKLATEHRITLDWIYRGNGEGLSYPMYIRLIGAIEMGTPPPEVRPEPEPEPESAGPGYPQRKVGAARPREREKPANAA
jgi:hypothetical protein